MSLSLLSGCANLRDAVSPRSSSDEAAAAAAPTATATPVKETVLNSQFTKDGTFQSHIEVDGMDFVYTIWPTKSTPRTNDWYARGDKHFSFTLTAYDLERDLRDPFRTKRRVYLEQIRVSSRTTTTSGASESPYSLSSDASRITFDPEPVKTRRGMLITSPKGAFELRNQKIGELATDTNGITLTFEATVHIQSAAKSKRYTDESIRQEVPISIFPSDKPTKVARIPFDAN